ncbi:hypothetical protein Pint_08734 [Pistacia integerrima]|uniref:Uncharacterized protein n=1 Tax=Pistacia integerrima TaxID=434235 RepID=A0ACC0XXZ7_9ROSI|nr:hypothetical protein Pint_08734 [Pistacia integerrima]
MTDDMDRRTDVEMIETETVTATQPRLDQVDVATELLTLARQLINQGKPSQALQAVVMAMRTKGGEEAVFLSLHRARELYRSRLQENTAADQLAALFAECVIAEAQPLNVEPPPCPVVAPSLAANADGTSILAETGRMQIVLDAYSDGSSFFCLQCGGLVSNHRKDEHYAYWCCKL